MGHERPLINIIVLTAKKPYLNFIYVFVKKFI